VAYFRIISDIFSDRGKPRKQDFRSSGRDLNPGYSEYEEGSFDHSTETVPPSLADVCEGVSKSFRTEPATKYTLITINTH
jgi:hypothetical protein